LFDLNLSSGDMSNETDVTIYEGYTQKSSIAIGNRDYLKGTISCIAGTVTTSNTLSQTVDYLDDLRAFINNKRAKYLKSRKGDVWKVVTWGMSVKYMDELSEQVATITFNFFEVI
jgi:hypothetical protein